MNMEEEFIDIENMDPKELKEILTHPEYR